MHNISCASRHVAVAIPAKDEQEHLRDCLAALDQAAACYGGAVTIVALANNCSDGSIDLLRQTRLRFARLQWHALSLLPGSCHVGWARRMAFDMAASLLRKPSDVLASTDADTSVAPDWIVRTVAHLNTGVDAVAGRALIRHSDRASLGVRGTQRLNMLGRYHTALDWLRADLKPVRDDPWPRHFYEGGASIALTLDLYRRIGGSPTPSVAEDRALFAAVRNVGGRVRHPLDLRVFTSGRTQGRALGGMADAVARWIVQTDDEPLHETYTFPVALDPASASSADRLTFRTLPAAIATAGVMIRARRSAAAPQIKPILVSPLLAHDRDGVIKQPDEFGNRLVA